MGARRAEIRLPANRKHAQDALSRLSGGRSRPHPPGSEGARLGRGSPAEPSTLVRGNHLAQQTNESTPTRTGCIILLQSQPRAGVVVDLGLANFRLYLS